MFSGLLWVQGTALQHASCAAELYGPGAGERRSLPQFTTLAAAGAGRPEASRLRSQRKIMKGPARVNTAGPFLTIIIDFPRYRTIRETISPTACSIPAKTARAMMLCPMFSSSISDISTIGWTL